MSNNPVLPVLHMNGTSKKELRYAHLQSVYKLQDALAVLHSNPPHNRDYYPASEPGLWNMAVQQHKERITKINEVMNELITLIEGIDNGGHKG